MRKYIVSLIVLVALLFVALPIHAQDARDHMVRFPAYGGGEFVLVFNSNWVCGLYINDEVAGDMLDINDEVMGEGICYGDPADDVFSGEVDVVIDTP